MSGLLQIKVKSLDDARRKAGEVFEQVAAGQAVQKKEDVYFGNLREMRRFLTERRLELLKTVKQRKPASVYAQAKLLHRDLKNVLQDVAYLRDLGILDVTDAGDKKVPHVRVDMSLFAVAI